MLPGETILSGAPVDEHTSEFMVMKSFAGWYVGTMYRHKDEHGEWEEPNSRETEYFATEAEAQAALASFKSGNDLTGAR